MLRRILLVAMMLLLYGIAAAAQNPVISQTSPTSATVSSTGLTLIVNGSGFRSGCVVLWNGSALTSAVISNHEIDATVTTLLLSQIGGVQISVYDATSGQVSIPILFQVSAPAAAVQSWAPSSFTTGVGVNLTVYGQGFTSAAVVYFDWTPVTTTFISSNQVNAVVSGSLVTAGHHSIHVINGQPAAATKVLKLNPQPVTFPDTVIGVTSSAITATVTNTGSATVTISAVSIGGINGGDYALSSNTCGVLTASSTCTVNVAITPSFLSARIGLLSVTSDAVGSPQSLNLFGNGLPTPGASLNFSPAIIQFPDTVQSSTSSPVTSTVTNTGAVTVNIGTIVKSGSNAADYDTSTSTCIASTTVLLTGQQCNLTGTFTPSTAFPENNAVITVTHNAPGSPQAIALNGNGIPAAAPGVNINPTSMAFGNWVTSTPSSPITVTVTNNGQSNLVISAETSSNADFALTGTPCITTLVPAQSCPVTVIFTPSGTSTESANISLTDNAVGSPHLIPLSGMGVASGGAHYASLTWTASGSSGLIGYNVYRSGQSGGPYTLLTPTPINTLAYTDNMVTSGQTYYYVVTSVGTNPPYSPTESLNSGQASATIP